MTPLQEVSKRADFLMGRSPPLAISYYVPENQVINFTPIHDLVVKVVMAGYYPKNGRQFKPI